MNSIKIEVTGNTHGLFSKFQKLQILCFRSNLCYKLHIYAHLLPQNQLTFKLEDGKTQLIRQLSMESLALSFWFWGEDSATEISFGI